MGKFRTKKNFGWARSPWYAGLYSLYAYYGEGKYATKAAHINRWSVFCRYLRKEGIRDCVEVDREVLIRFAHHLHEAVACAKMQKSYSVNLVSTVNVVMRAMRGDSAVWISPRKYLGSRVRSRIEPPLGMNLQQVLDVASELRSRGHESTAIIVLLARGLGLRKKEACLMDMRVARRQATTKGSVNVVKGTKGGRGRNVDRWVEVPDWMMDVLYRASILQGNNKNLVPPDMNLKIFIARVNRNWRTARDQFGMAKIHDLRASYVCEQYAVATGQPAPVLASGDVIPPEKSAEGALLTLSNKVGHGRREVLSAYVGSSTRRRRS